MTGYNVNDSDLEVRPLLIFTTYIATALALSLVIVRDLYIATARTNKTGHRGLADTKVGIFAALSTVSLGVTWFYMIAFFAHSYHTWAIQTKHEVPTEISGTFTSLAPLKVLGLWLRDSKLFREAWETASNNNAKFWWTQPIFFITTAWSVFLDQRGRFHNIPRRWPFMVLGQIVAVSFAMNLFYLAVLLNPSSESVRTKNPTSKKSTRFPVPNLVLYGVLLSVVLGAICLIPYAADTHLFLTFLSIPHLLLMIPPLFRNILPLRFWTFMETKAAANQRYNVLLGFVLAVGLLMQTKVTLAVLDSNSSVTGSTIFRSPTFSKSSTQSGLRKLHQALYEHPAVSSVGWDSVLCCLSASAWSIFGD